MFVKKRNAYSNHCRTCQSVISKEHYLRNKANVIRSSLIRNSDLRDRLSSARDKYIELHAIKCEACGLSGVQLYVMNRVGYAGVSVRQIIKDSLPEEKLAEALKQSVFRCLSCTGKITGGLRSEEIDIDQQ